MKRPLQLLSRAFGFVAAGSPSAPEELVRMFQADYFNWNNAAVALDHDSDPEGAMAEAEARYAKLLTRYTMPGFKGYGVTFGDDPAHDPARERVLESRIDGDSALVRTEFTQDGYSPVYEYELMKSDGRWYLTEIYLVDSDGRHPGL